LLDTATLEKSVLESTQAVDNSSVVTIRGRKLNLRELVAPCLQDPEYLQKLRGEVLSAHPFPHAVVDGWFNPTLLELIVEEFEEAAVTWKKSRGRHEKFLRSQTASTLGPATQLYFDIIHSGWFVRTVSAVTGAKRLIVDTQLFGGGLHETRSGGHFDVHRDFDRHPETGLNNEMVLITYLNKQWQPEWSGALGLWDKNKEECLKTIEPEFGRTIILLHGPASFHGHPGALSVPEGVFRRSIAAYYYSNKNADIDRAELQGSKFLHQTSFDHARRIALGLLPPLLKSGLRMLIKGRR
jgi:Rps23 Pro-64 3,4-dihydroxylase Tpa1-like proline 4-hydroxylase